MLLLLCMCDRALGYFRAGRPSDWNPCPKTRAWAIAEGHSIPLTVYYTGKFDSRLDRSRHWPVNATFAYVDNKGLEVSMRRLATALEIDGLFDAFDSVLPWAYRSDIWRYAILYTCGGVYVDSKFTLVSSFSHFLNRIGFHKATMRSTTLPQLFSPLDERASDSIRDPNYKGIKCVYQAFLATEQRNPLLLRTLQHVISNVEKRWYPPSSVSRFANLFITGPCAMAIALGRHEHEGLQLTSRLGYNAIGRKPWRAIRYIVPDDLERTRDSDDEMQLATFVANERLHSLLRSNYYIDMFENRVVYKDDLLRSGNRTSKIISA